MRDLHVELAREVADEGCVAIRHARGVLHRGSCHDELRVLGLPFLRLGDGGEQDADAREGKSADLRSCLRHLR